MIRIAIVEDEEEHAKTIQQYCGRYSTEKHVDINYVWHSNPVSFLEKYRAEYDIVFMDIMMPMMNGMDCASRLREQDGSVVLCFITSMAQYAIRGYEVNAFDFILKPVAYTEFCMKLDRILRFLNKRVEATVLISSRNTVNNVVVRDLAYVEVYNHMLIYHTRMEQYEAYGKLSELESDERFKRFIRITPSHLVNCDQVSSITDDSVTVSGIQLPVSRRRRKECLEKMALLLGGGRA